MLIVGSDALRNYCDINRTPRDIDIMGTYDECMDFIKSSPGELYKCYPINEGKKIVAFKGTTIFEAEIAWEGSTAEEFIQLEKRNFGNSKYASLNGLYALKMSHRFLRNSPAFLKTMKDIHLMRSLGITIHTEYQAWYQRRKKETYYYEHPNLKKSKKDFFTDTIEYVYDHDSIHEAMKVFDKPAYHYYMKPGAEVQSSEELFFDLSNYMRLRGVLEESYVLALERSQIPYGEKIPPKKSFEIALKKVCTSITSGWFRNFAWENYDEILFMYEDDFVEKFWSAVDQKIVKKM